LTIHDTGALPPSILEEERRSGMPEALIKSEYLCSFDAATIGAVFADLIEKLGERSGITTWDVGTPEDCFTSWDLGLADSTAMSVCEGAYSRLYKGVDPDFNSLVFDLPFKDGVKRMATPEVGILAKFQQLAAFHLSRWGLSPADRARVDGAPVSPGPGEPGADPLSEFDSE
jgi:hypothetical protein